MEEAALLCRNDAWWGPVSRDRRDPTSLHRASGTRSADSYTKSSPFEVTRLFEVGADFHLSPLEFAAHHQLTQ
jgi:hypothetical protein